MTTREFKDAQAARLHLAALYQRQAEEYGRQAEEYGRRIERMRFLLEGVAQLMPEIPLADLPLGQLVARVEPTHPELAAQIRELVELSETEA